MATGSAGAGHHPRHAPAASTTARRTGKREPQQHRPDRHDVIRARRLVQERELGADVEVAVEDQAAQLGEIGHAVGGHAVGVGHLHAERVKQREPSRCTSAVSRTATAQATPRRRESRHDSHATTGRPEANTSHAEGRGGNEIRSPSQKMTSVPAPRGSYPEPVPGVRCPLRGRHRANSRPAAGGRTARSQVLRSSDLRSQSTRSPDHQIRSRDHHVARSPDLIFLLPPIPHPSNHLPGPLVGDLAVRHDRLAVDQHVLRCPANSASGST